MPDKKPKALPKFEGRQVLASRITVPGMGGGLNDALDVEPIALKHGQSGFAVFQWEVRDVDHVPLKKGESAILARHHVLTASRVMIVDDEQSGLIEEWLNQRDLEVRRAKDSMAGQEELELSDEEREVKRKLEESGIG